jgi:hypothetical protein
MGVTRGSRLPTELDDLKILTVQSNPSLSENKRPTCCKCNEQCNNNQNGSEEKKENKGYQYV